MGSLSRRGLLLAIGSGVAASAFSARASATVVRSMSLVALSKGARGIAVVTALDSESHFEDLGRRIVTDTRVRIEENLAKSEGMDRELLVRTLGGNVGRQGERVHGQVQWAMGEPCVAFLLQGPDGIHYVNGMAQGHYPLLERTEPTLTTSPDLPEIVDIETSAVRQLSGSALRHARELIRSAVRP
jgi:hypothetical protein